MKKLKCFMGTFFFTSSFTQKLKAFFHTLEIWREITYVQHQYTLWYLIIEVKFQKRPVLLYVP